MKRIEEKIENYLNEVKFQRGSDGSTVLLSLRNEPYKVMLFYSVLAHKKDHKKGALVPKGQPKNLIFPEKRDIRRLQKALEEQGFTTKLNEEKVVEPDGKDFHSPSITIENLYEVTGKSKKEVFEIFKKFFNKEYFYEYNNIQSKVPDVDGIFMDRDSPAWGNVPFKDLARELVK